MAGEATITRTFDAPRETVWRYFTEPELFGDWFGHAPYTTPPDRVSFDLRPGGRWSAAMVHESDGSELPFGGEIREVSAPERLVQTFDDPENPGGGDVLTTTLKDLGDGRTEVTYHQVGQMPADEYRRVEEGVGGFYDRLAEALANA